MPSKLRVRGLVVVVAEVGGAGRLLEEVSDPAPSVELERGLVDDVGALAHGLLGFLDGALKVPVVLDSAGASDPGAGRLKQREVGSLVLLALFLHQVSLRVLRRREVELTAAASKLERGQMLALEKVVQVRGREGDAVTGSAHDRMIA